MVADPVVDRRSTPREPRVVYLADTARLVLALPDHRLRPGATVTYAGLDGRERSVTLPDHAAPGRTVRLTTDESYRWPSTVELVLLTAQ